MRLSLKDYIERTDRVSSTEELFHAFDQFVRPCGIDVSSYHILSRRLRSVPLETGQIRSTFPEDWIGKYLDRHYSEIDPLHQQARKQARPFHWFKVDERMKLSHEQRLFLKELKKAGLKDGLAVPIFGPMGTMAYFGLGSMEHALDLSDQEITELQFACHHTHNIFTELSKDFSDDEECVSLSGRETEILTLVAAGLSNVAIAERLGITENTVDTILRRAFRKLGANNRITAVLKGIGCGLIVP